MGEANEGIHVNPRHVWYFLNLQDDIGSVIAKYVG